MNAAGLVGRDALRNRDAGRPVHNTAVTGSVEGYWEQEADVVFLVESATIPSKRYRTTANGCECEGWYYRKTCWHVEAVRDRIAERIACEICNHAKSDHRANGCVGCDAFVLLGDLDVLPEAAHAFIGLVA